jgi:hypothetical protein
MYTPTDELVLHAQRAFDLCRDQVYDYEDCRQLDYAGTVHPSLCKKESYSLMQCYEKVEKTEPVCLTALNNYRECYFKYSGYLMMCEREITEFNRCQEDPQWYRDNVYYRREGHKRVYDPYLYRPRF